MDIVDVESISVCQEFIIYCPVGENADKMDVVEVPVEDIDDFLINLKKVKFTAGPYAVVNQDVYSDGHFFVMINGERAFDIREDTINVDYRSAIGRGWYDMGWSNRWGILGITSRIGYLIVYGNQIFKMDLVMMGVFILAIIAFLMYEVVNIFEKKFKKKRGI